MIIRPRPIKEGEHRQACTCSRFPFPHHHIAPIDITRWPGETETVGVEPRRPPRKPNPVKP